MDPYTALMYTLRQLLGPLIKMPWSALTATVLSMLCVAISRAISGLITREDKLSYALEEIAKWEKKRAKALKEKDRKLYEHVLREKPRIDRLRSRVAAERAKSNVISLVLWFALFKFVSDIFAGEPVAVLPIFNYAPVTLPIWYVLTSLWFAPLLSRVMKQEQRRKG